MPSFLGMDLRGHLDLLLLATLARTGPSHGYAIITALRDHSSGTFDLPEGTVYPALHRLERDGSVASRWSDDAPRRRRVYELTSTGHAALATREREWRTFARAVTQVSKLSLVPVRVVFS
jgi:PadR family transcriptional regulator, regulatory protein PadR